MKKLNRLQTLIQLILTHEPNINTGYLINKYIQTNLPMVKASHQQVYRDLAKMGLAYDQQTNEGKPDSKHYRLGVANTPIDVTTVDSDVLTHFKETDLIKERVIYLTEKRAVLAEAEIDANLEPSIAGAMLTVEIDRLNQAIERLTNLQETEK